MSKSSRRIVSFELPESVYQALEDEATARGTSSVHKRAREILVEHFTDSTEIQDQLDSLGMDMAWLGNLVRRTAYAVIVHAAGRDSAEANAWIRENMAHTQEQETV
jgi:hypothetical protein